MEENQMQCGKYLVGYTNEEFFVSYDGMTLSIHKSYLPEHLWEKVPNISCEGEVKEILHTYREVLWEIDEFVAGFLN